MSTRDHFSASADGYARFRPGYDPALGAWLASIAPGNALAVDVATGSGQAARILAPHFDRVIACDTSAAQIAAADAPDNVQFVIAAAEQLPLPDRSVDLVTVAQALHWFDVTRFVQEAGRILRPEGVLAAWTYNRLTVSPAVDAIIERLYADILGRWWPPERRHVENTYADLPFPEPGIAARAFSMQTEWSSAELLGYLRTWSAWRACIDAGNSDPLIAMESGISTAFGEGRRPVTWPLSMRLWRAPGE